MSEITMKEQHCDVTERGFTLKLHLHPSPSSLWCAGVTAGVIKQIHHLPVCVFSLFLSVIEALTGQMLDGTSTDLTHWWLQVCVIHGGTSSATVIAPGLPVSSKRPEDPLVGPVRFVRNNRRETRCRPMHVLNFVCFHFVTRVFCCCFARWWWWLLPDTPVPSCILLHVQPHKMTGWTSPGPSVSWD